jgi:ribonuclease T1
VTRGRSLGAALAGALVALAAVWLVDAQSGPVATDGSGQASAPSSQAPRTTEATGITEATGFTEATGSAEPTEPVPGLSRVEYADISPEAHRTIGLIHTGGPFPYEQDGEVFGNRELLLPMHAYGYYREYTVDTPGSDDRGARRIVAGDGGELFYTDDHYESFRRVRR